jgi:hypothetical protein
MIEKRLLQCVVVLACVVPIVGGGYGVLRGLAMLEFGGASVGADSHFRYLSGLLLGIGLGFLTTVPRIETHAARFRLLAAIVVIGGLGRLLSVVLGAAADPTTLFALVMELVVTPLLALWQWRVAQSGRG